MYYLFICKKVDFFFLLVFYLKKKKTNNLSRVKTSTISFLTISVHALILVFDWKKKKIKQKDKIPK